MPDREKLIELLTQVAVIGDYLDMRKVADHLISNGVTVQDSKGVEIDPFNKWISVNDRLPEHPEYDWVLVQVKMNPEDYYGVPRIAELRNGVWYDEDDLPLEEFRSVKVTHWMPLPQPPKGLSHG